MSATPSSSCPFAENVFYAVATSQARRELPENQLFHATVFSPATSKSYPVDCVEARSDAVVSCTNDADGSAQVAFSIGSATSYSGTQAAAFASTHQLGPTTSRQADGPSTSSTGASAPSQSEGPGSYEHTGDAAFCSDHVCIENFPNGNGFVVQCSDGAWSHSGGLSGACSDHGGEA